jgi:rhamnulokinase
VGRVGRRHLSLEEVHRFPNEPVALPDGLHWDALGLYREVLVGLRLAARSEPDVRSVAVDTWAIDFGLLGDDGGLIANPYAYRDPRAQRGVDVVHAALPPEVLYARTGLAFLPFKTMYQLAASLGTVELENAKSLLLMPDLLGYWLTGVGVGEMTNASTTGLFDVLWATWATDLAEAVGLPASILPELRPPGERLGAFRREVIASTGLGSAAEVTLVGSHDTASAIVGVPAEDDRFAYISCGTWALVGVELEAPVLSEASRSANFTNERGVDGRIRFLRNVTGLWLLQESLRTWEREGTPEDLDSILAAAASLTAGGPIVDLNDPAFLAPGDMPTRIAEACQRAGVTAPTSRPGLVRCILDSLAATFARTLDEITRIAGREIRVVHLVGGGSRNELLCQLTADASGLAVVAGPVEATAIGNVLVQARTAGWLDGDLDDLRSLVRTSQPLRRYEPRHQSTPVLG